MDRQDRVIDIQGSESAQPTVATYSIEVACHNCDYRGETQIPKGTPVGGSPCPNCGCQTVAKSLPAVTPAAPASTGTPLTQSIRKLSKNASVAAQRRSPIGECSTRSYRSDR